MALHSAPPPRGGRNRLLAESWTLLETFAEDVSALCASHRDRLMGTVATAARARERASLGIGLAAAEAWGLKNEDAEKLYAELCGDDEELAKLRDAVNDANAVDSVKNGEEEEAGRDGGAVDEAKAAVEEKVMRALGEVLNRLSDGQNAHLLRTKEGKAATVLFHTWQDACNRRANAEKEEREIAQKRRSSTSRMQALTNGGGGGGGACWRTRLEVGRRGDLTRQIWRMGARAGRSGTSLFVWKCSPFT